jgi:surface antigen
MRRTLATLAVMAASAAALAVTAVPASADDPNVTYNGYEVLGVSDSLGCTTAYKLGNPGQYGAWGSFIDGCTVKLFCPSNVQRCDVNGSSSIRTYYLRGQRVTLNARLRRFEAGGRVYSWSDRSCDRTDRCEASDSSFIAAGQSASVQCNGVRASTAGNPAQVHCGVGLSYRPLDRTSQQGRGECTDWALYRRPDLAGVVSGNAQNWTAGARAAGRTVSKTPSQGALMVFQGGVLGAFISTGHVAYVESVQRDAYGRPTSFVVSEQNMNGVRTPTQRTIQVSSLPATGVDFIG